MTSPESGWNQNPAGTPNSPGAAPQPPAGGYPPQPGTPPPGGAYPQQPGAPQQPGGYPPGGYPQQGANPQQGGYPPQPDANPQQGGYAPQPGGYPQQPGSYPQAGGAYPQQAGAYPQQPGGQPPGHYPGQGSPAGVTTSPKSKRTLGIVLGAVAVVVVAAIIAAAFVVPRLTAPKEISSDQVDQIFVSDVAGLQNSPGKKMQSAKSYFITSSSDACVIGISTVLVQADTVQQITSAADKGASEGGWVVAWDSSSKAQRGFEKVKSALESCRTGHSVGQDSDRDPRYASISGKLTEKSSSSQFALMQHSNVLVLTQLTGIHPMGPWSKEIANRIDELG